MWIVGHLHKLPIWFSSSKTDTWVDFKNSVFQIVAKGKKKKKTFLFYENKVGYLHKFLVWFSSSKTNT
jgi:Cys-tRNA synthase (O-phospho-L-seryl-tRNA:Cys-tRNA synthase)